MNHCDRCGWKNPTEKYRFTFGERDMSGRPTVVDEHVIRPSPIETCGGQQLALCEPCFNWTIEQLHEFVKNSFPFLFADQVALPQPQPR